MIPVWKTQPVYNILPRCSVRLGWLHSYERKKNVNLETEIQQERNNRGSLCARAPWPMARAAQATSQGSSCWGRWQEQRTPFSSKMHLLAQATDAGWRQCPRSSQESFVLTTWELQESREGQYGHSSHEAEGSCRRPCFCTYTFARWSRLGPW